MKQLLIIFLFVIVALPSCFWGDEPYEYKKLTKDFWLHWWAEPNDKHILLSTEKDGNGGLIVVGETIFAVGYNDSFIIAKQHPNLEKEIGDRLFNYDTVEKAYLLTDPNDTVYLAENGDSIYHKNGKVYHISNGWNPPDSLKPYRKATNYYIIDIRNYSRHKPKSYSSFQFDTESAFLKKKQELKISDKLNFSIVDSTLL